MMGVDFREPILSVRVAGYPSKESISTYSSYATSTSHSFMWMIPPDLCTISSKVAENY